MKRVMLLLTIAIPFTILFSGCDSETKYIKTSVPKLRVCRVSETKVRVTIRGNNVYMLLSEYKKLKRQNHRLRVCNDLLNKQNRDFNKRFAR